MERVAIAVRGSVQGVGFRPFVYHLAAECGLSGFVKNQSGEVCIEVEGEQAALDLFLADLIRRRPPLAEIEEVSRAACPTLGDQTFRIAPSEAGGQGDIVFGPDLAPCSDCLAELFDPTNRHFRYPFLNCTHCGPRLTVVRASPYDRERTTLAGFPMCTACQAEYDDPDNRRFHAQPTACPACGPRLQLQDGQGVPIVGDDPIAFTVDALGQGHIVAIKGVGGYHLACDATQETVVRRLRTRKNRDEKPFALMVVDLEAARELADVSEAEAQRLLSPRRPIVLLHKRADSGVAESVAPGNPCLGIMLPYSPLHVLLLDAIKGVPIVLTSGNRSDEPMAISDDEAIERLASIADIFLTNNRPIHLRCDDSVLRVVAGRDLPIRRSRGQAPHPIRLPAACRRPMLAVGGQLKNTFALGRGRHALLGHHLGDLDHFEAYKAFVQAVTHYEDLFDVHPQIIVHDLHPDYASTRYAIDSPFDRLAVQHHHAHLASCMAENNLTGPVLGVILDGTGFGLDGAVWGGEFLVGDYRAVRRAAHLRYIGMPGGEQAIREPWRMALAHLLDAGCSPAILSRYTSPQALRLAEKMLDRRVNCPLTSSMGRLFDAVAALAGVRGVVSYEGQAAVELEALAARECLAGVYPFGLEASLQIDTRALIEAVVGDVQAGRGAGVIARRFHSTIVEMIARVCRTLGEQTGLNKVVLSGGVFLNAILTEEVTARLSADEFEVYRHQRVPPNDGGLSLGQLAIAVAQL